jgi:hypothetical protein
MKVDLSVFPLGTWQRSVRFGGPPLYLIDDNVILSADARTLLRSFGNELFVGSNIEVIGANAFQYRHASSVVFESGTKLREIGPRAFADCDRLTAFAVPESVEIFGDGCFQACSNLRTITFERSSRLKRIGARAFYGHRLRSITIPALTEEIDGSAFVNCPVIEIKVAPDNANFRVERNMLVTSDGTEIVRYFGLDREIVVGKRVRVLGKSCCEGCKQLDQIDFEIGSKLERIGPCALCDCESLSSVEIPASVTVIEKYAFEGCDGLESCSMDEDSSLVTIGYAAFANCASLKSFTIPRRVGEISNDCFIGCKYLYRLKFKSSESLKRVVGDRSMDDARDKLGVSLQVRGYSGLRLKMGFSSC